MGHREGAMSCDDEDNEPDLLADPTFVPCRDERCPYPWLHREHEVTNGVRGPRRLDSCPRCQTAVVVTKSKEEVLRSNGSRLVPRTRITIKAECPECGWTFENKNRKKDKP